MPPRPKPLGSRLRLYRTRLGLTIPELSRRSGVSVGTISNAENNVGDIRVSNLVAILAALGQPNPFQ